MEPAAGIDLLAARRRLEGLVLMTPLIGWPGRKVWLKCEQEQLTGSFKVRGALNKVLALSAEERSRGLVAASAGNHGIGVALAGKMVGARTTVVVPGNVVGRKRRALERLGAEVRLANGDFGVAEIEAKGLARRRGAVWVSPYNDPAIIAGQGTVGLEIADQLRRSGEDSGVEVYVPVSGGGLISGVGLGLRLAGLPVRLVGVQAEAAPYMHRFFHGGDPGQVIESPTLADGLAGPVEAGSTTFELVRDLVDDIILVSEAEIRSALLAIHRELSLEIEPSAAAAAAAALRWAAGGTRLAVLSGGNVDPGLIERLAADPG